MIPQDPGVVIFATDPLVGTYVCLLTVGLLFLLACCFVLQSINPIPGTSCADPTLAVLLTFVSLYRIIECEVNGPMDNILMRWQASFLENLAACCYTTCVVSLLYFITYNVFNSALPEEVRLLIRVMTRRLIFPFTALIWSMNLDEMSQYVYGTSSLAHILLYFYVYVITFIGVSMVADKCFNHLLERSAFNTIVMLLFTLFHVKYCTINTGARFNHNIWTFAFTAYFCSQQLMLW
ncbi:protein E7 [Proboscivirus elephantidbeta4]|uniref:Protein E7 n=1 Tax=Elephant endotheliotropic herpesvirus 4 TaxID=548914 RepID=A0A0S1TQU4_9BETA|nr:protein E7 [Elephant endotheliotropic herpesvirus 4]ALM25937.1 protein E7 [Elephant endotheliotropic herpesvirus 4]